MQQHEEILEQTEIGDRSTIPQPTPHVIPALANEFGLHNVTACEPWPFNGGHLAKINHLRIYGPQYGTDEIECHSAIQVVPINGLANSLSAFMLTSSITNSEGNLPIVPVCEIDEECLEKVSNIQIAYDHIFLDKLYRRFRHMNARNSDFGLYAPKPIAFDRDKALYLEFLKDFGEINPIYMDEWDHPKLLFNPANVNPEIAEMNLLLVEKEFQYLLKRRISFLMANVYSATSHLPYWFSLAAGDIVARINADQLKNAKSDEEGLRAIELAIITFRGGPATIEEFFVTQGIYESQILRHQLEVDESRIDGKNASSRLNYEALRASLGGRDYPTIWYKNFPITAYYSESDVSTRKPNVPRYKLTDRVIFDGISDFLELDIP